MESFQKLRESQQLGRKNDPVGKDGNRKFDTSSTVEDEDYVLVPVPHPGERVVGRKPVSRKPREIDQTSIAHVNQSAPVALQPQQCHSHNAHHSKNTERSQCFESRNHEEQKVNEQSKEAEGVNTTATSKSDRIILPDEVANGIMEKMCLTKGERAYRGMPSKFHVEKHGYQRFKNIRDTRYKSYSGELRETAKEFDYSKVGIVALGVEYVHMKDGTRQPVRTTLVSTRMKVMFRQKIKLNGSVRDYRVEETGLTAAAMGDVTGSLAQRTKKICDMLTTHTILVSFAPEEDLHLMKIAHDRVISVPSLYKKDLECGMNIDRHSLVERYLPEEYRNVVAPCQAMALTLRWYAVHNYVLNVRHIHGMYDCLPIFPLIKPPATEIECSGKQTLISLVHEKLSWRYRHILIRQPNPVIHGTKVVRVHVKKWLQLKGIELRLLGLSLYIRKMLKLPEADHEEFRMISLPVSMKSTTQAKGFFVYLDFESEQRAQLAIKYFTTEFENEGEMVKYKCELSIPKKAKEVDRKRSEQSKTYSIIAHSKARC